MVVRKKEAARKGLTSEERCLRGNREQKRTGQGGKQGMLEGWNTAKRESRSRSSKESAEE